MKSPNQFRRFVNCPFYIHTHTQTNIFFISSYSLTLGTYIPSLYPIIQYKRATLVLLSRVMLCDCFRTYMVAQQLFLRFWGTRRGSCTLPGWGTHRQYLFGKEFPCKLFVHTNLIERLVDMFVLNWWQLSQFCIHFHEYYDPSVLSLLQGNVSQC